MPVCSSHSATRPLASQVQAFLEVNPVGFLVIDQPAFSPQWYVDVLGAVTKARGRNLMNPSSLVEY